MDAQPGVGTFLLGLPFPCLAQSVGKVLIDQEESGEEDSRGVAGKKRK